MTALTVVCGVLFFHQLGWRDLWSSHEARAGQNAQGLLENWTWGVPRLNDLSPELQKPPLYYWLVAGIAKLRGGAVDAVAVRLPAALSAAACVFAVYLFLWSRGRRRAGLIGALILATANHFTAASRVGRIDMLLTLTVTVAVIGLVLGQERRANGWYLAAFLAIAAGILLKGPLGFVLPFAVWFIWQPAAHGRTQALKAWLWGLPLILILTAPWFIFADRQTDGEFSRVFFWHHHIERATGTASTLSSHPSWYYVQRLAVDLLPWSPAVLFAVWQFIRGRSNHDSDARFGLVWFSTVVVLLSLSRFKRVDYLLPAYPGLAIWLGCVVEAWFRGTSVPRRITAAKVGFVAVVGIVIVVWQVYLANIEPRLDAEREKKTLAVAIRSIVPHPEPVYFFRVEDHLLAFHLGRPLNTFLEWENLDVWAGRPGRHFILMPADCAAEWPRNVGAGPLHEVIRYDDRTDRGRRRSLVLMRTGLN